MTRKRRRDERGRVSGPTLAALVVAGLIVVGVAVGVGVAGRGSGDDGQVATDTPTCEPTTENPGPLLDLTVKVDTGSAAEPFRSEQEVGDLLDAARDAGADIVSTPVSWRVVQPREGGAFDFRGLDRVVDGAAERGMQVKVQLLHMNRWAMDPGAAKYGPWAPPRSEAELDAWTGFVRRTVEHLDGRARFVEIWTSPDLESHWRTGVDAGEYARMLEASARTARDVDSGVQVISGGVDGDQEYLDAMLGELDDGPLPFDLLGVHAFGDEGAMTDPAALFEGALDALDAQGLDVPVYLTELGWSTVAMPDDARAERTASALDAIVCDTRVRVVSWYALHQTQWDGPRWALLEDGLEPTLTYEALAEWSRRREAAVGDAAAG